MRRFTTSMLILTTVIFTAYAISNAQEAHSHHAKETSTSAAKKFKIVPLVTVKPGETKELLMSTWCTVGATRGGGFTLAQMVDGKPQFNGSKLAGNRSYSGGGVTMTVPGWGEATKFANSAEFSSLKERHLQAFTVSITASSDAKPGLMEMHLLDATCSGECSTDFRVLVVGEKGKSTR